MMMMGRNTLGMMIMKWLSPMKQKNEPETYVEINWDESATLIKRYKAYTFLSHYRGLKMLWQVIKTWKTMAMTMNNKQSFKRFTCFVLPISNICLIKYSKSYVKRGLKRLYVPHIGQGHKINRYISKQQQQ